MSNELTTASNVTSFLDVIQRAASDPNIDVDKMSKILDMQERILNKNAEVAFNSAMVALQKEMPRIIKSSENKQTSSHYAKMQNIDKVITPIYTSHGFALSFGTGESPLENHVRITCEIMHQDGHSKHRFYDLALDDKGIKGSVNKTLIHASASSITYGQRILKCLIFNLQLTDDVDGNKPKEETVSEEQQANLQALIDEVGESGRKALFDWLKITDLSDVPAKHYNKAVEGLERRRKS